jgi:hypothetical protein
MNDNIPAGTIVTVRTTNGGVVVAPLAETYAPTTYLASRRVVIERPSEHGDYTVIPGYRVKSVVVFVGGEA